MAKEQHRHDIRDRVWENQAIHHWRKGNTVIPGNLSTVHSGHRGALPGLAIPRRKAAASKSKVA